MQFVQSFVVVCLRCLKNKSTKLWCNLEGGVSTRKVTALVGMSQSHVTHMRNDVLGEIERQRGGRSKRRLLADQEKRRYVTFAFEGGLGFAYATTKQLQYEIRKLLYDIIMNPSLKEVGLGWIGFTSATKEAIYES